MNTFSSVVCRFLSLTVIIMVSTLQVGVAAFDLRSASFHLSQYIETGRSYQNTKTLLNFYDPMVIIVTPTKMAPDGMVGVSELVDRSFSSTTKVVFVQVSILSFLAPQQLEYLFYESAGCNGSWLL